MAFDDINRDGNILVLDSGNGGKYTLNIIKKVLPNENYIFIEDDLNCPYGQKNKRKLTKISKKIIKKALNLYKIKIIVLACNTLSSACLSSLKKEFSHLPIIPTLPVLKKFKKNTLILCTTATKKYNKQFKTIKGSKKIQVVGFGNLAKKIDDNIDNLDILQPFLNKKLKKYANMDISNVVLGCTHYNLAKKQICNALLQNSEKSYVKLSSNRVKKIFNTKTETKTQVFTKKHRNINFYEASPYVAKQVKQTLKAISLLSNSIAQGKTIYIKTSDLF